MFMTDRMVGLAICSDPQMAAALELHYPVIVPR